MNKNIKLVGFKDLDKTELESINKILATYLPKINYKTDYERLKIRLKMRQRAKIFVHELKADLMLHPGNSISSNVSDKNLYRAMAELLQNIINEIDHKYRTQDRIPPRKKLMRKLFKKTI